VKRGGKKEGGKAQGEKKLEVLMGENFKERNSDGKEKPKLGEGFRDEKRERNGNSRSLNRNWLGL